METLGKLAWDFRGAEKNEEAVQLRCGQNGQNTDFVGFVVTKHPEFTKFNSHIAARDLIQGWVNYVQ